MLLAITLIGNPEHRLTQQDVDQAARLLSAPPRFSLNGKEWLMPDEACDIFAEGNLEDARLMMETWAEGKKVDIIVQDYQGRRKKALLADMESTIIQDEMLDQLAERAGIGAQVEEITKQAMFGEIDFKAALIARLDLLKGLDATIIQDLINKITYTPGAKELVATLRKHNCRTVLVSGGFTVFTEAVARKLRFDENHGNILAIRDNRIVGKPVDPILGKEAKLDRLKKTAQLLNISEKDICAVGDGANDIPMLMAAGLGVAYHAKPAVIEKTPYRINYANLRALIWAQGYRKEDLA